MNPILIFGMPRSGTTWIGKLFDSHPDTLYRHEPDSVYRLAMPLFPELAEAGEYRTRLQDFVAGLPRLRSPKVVGKQPLFRKSYHSRAALGAYSGSVMVAKLAGRVAHGAPCLYRPTGAGSRQTRLVWKSIESAGRLGVCMQALPEARAIHVLRHPCGYVASIMRGRRKRRFADARSGTDANWYLRLLCATRGARARGWCHDALARLTPEERLAASWVLVHEKALDDIGACERVLSIRYEDACRQPAATTQRLFAFADLAWHRQTAAFVHASSGGSDSDYYSVFKDSQSRAERWRAELAPATIARILAIVDDSHAFRGYHDAAPAAASLAEAAS